MAQVVVLTNAGKAITAKQVAGTASAPPKFLGIGTGTHVAAATDTALTNEVESRSGTNSPTTVTTAVTDDTFQVVQTITATALRAVVEAGLFDAASAGNMFLSATFDVVNLQSGDSIAVTGKVQYL